MARGKRTFGEVEKLPSGKYRARYTGPDGQRHKAPRTFSTKGDADAWLALRRAEVIKDDWSPPVQTGLRFGEYARGWLADRTLKPRTREGYEVIIERYLATFHDAPLKHITPDAVARWHAGLTTGPTMKAHAYSLLRTILNDAQARDLITANPCRIRGAGSAKRVHKVRPASLSEIEALVAAMPERLRLMVLLAAWCGLRFGELTALRRHDVTADLGTVRVRRGVVRTKAGKVEGGTKSAAGMRDVAIPPHLAPAVRDHLERHTGPARDALLFPAADGVSFMAPSSLYGRVTTDDKAGWGWYHARQVAGRPDLRWHDLRHTGAVLAASTGATLAELMARLGHSTPGAAMRYQHAAQGRDAIIAAKLSELVGG